ncbi:hypothetical protein OF829_12420 [Sphingomonas sp. LB-2]|uniref:DUF1579 family protein n=1 Tax=Sphingomonas caeni TaxID=2984949 RepID=UPI0022311B53|nr:DUF1579 family protein [Sphingomonas caeni]MCW3848046.1 hypothetical protein [Sphingomonas caeni]
MYRGTIAAALMAALAGCAMPAATGRDIYARIEARLTADPALAASVGKPAAQMSDVDWMVGRWEVSSAREETEKPEDKGISEVTRLFGGVWLEIRDTYPGNSVQDVSYLGFNPATRQWTSLGLDSYGNANIISAATGWNEGRLVFEGDFVVIGMKTRLRQIMTRRGPDAYSVENFEWVAGKWRLLDHYNYRRL